MVKLIDSNMISNIMHYCMYMKAFSGIDVSRIEYNRAFQGIERSLCSDIKAGNRLVYRRVKEMYKCKKVDNFTEIEPIGGLV